MDTWFENTPTTDYDGSYYGAKTFCASNGGHLPTFAELCPSGSAVGGNKDGDMWAPYDDGDSVNDWAQVGSGHTSCKKHNDLGKPGWGTVSTRATFQQWIMCRVPRAPLYTWFRNTQTTDYDGSYNGAKTFCASNGGQLPTFAELCPSGSAVGGNKNGDMWAPYDDGGSVNDWAQVGSGHSSCKKHNDWGKPGWGAVSTRATFQEWIMCKQ